MGKHIICTGAIVNFMVGKFDIKRFTKRFYSHKEKTQMMDFFENVLFNKIDELKQANLDKNYRPLEEAKLIGLYAGFIEDVAYKPSDVVDKSLVEAVLFLLRNRISMFKSLGLVDLLRSAEKLPVDTVKKIYSELKLK